MLVSNPAASTLPGCAVWRRNDLSEFTLVPIGLPIATVACAQRVVAGDDNCAMLSIGSHRRLRSCCGLYLNIRTITCNFLLKRPDHAALLFFRQTRGARDA